MNKNNIYDFCVVLIISLAASIWIESNLLGKFDLVWTLVCASAAISVRRRKAVAWFVFFFLYSIA